MKFHEISSNVADLKIREAECVTYSYLESA